jgi:Choline/Carnitine o-acyltransferase
MCVKVSTAVDGFALYGPVVDDGYGVCYNLHTGSIVACVTSRRARDSRRFAAALEESLRLSMSCCRQSYSRRYQLTMTPPLSSS